MGNYLLRKGMEYMSDALGTPVGRLLFNETVMLAPDLASRDINEMVKGSILPIFPGACTCITPNMTEH